MKCFFKLCLLILLQIQIFNNTLLYSQNLSGNIKADVEQKLEAVKYLKQKQDYNKVAILYCQIAVIYQNYNIPLEAINYFIKAEKIYEQLDSLEQLAIINTNIGGIYQGIEQYDSTLKYYNKSLNYRMLLYQSNEVGVCLLDISNVYSSMKQYDKAVYFVNEAIDIAKKKQNHKLLLNSYNRLSDIYNASGNKYKSKEFYYRYNHYIDSLNGLDYDLTSILEKLRIQYKQELKTAYGAKLTGSESQKEINQITDKKIDISEIRNKFLATDTNFAVNEQTSNFKYYDTGKNINSGKIFRKVDNMPEFYGGSFGIKLYLIRNINLSKQDFIPVKDSIIVQYVINKYGLVNKVKIIKGINPSLDNKILRLIKSMPIWKPGANNGKPVSVKLTSTIIFPLLDENSLLRSELKRYKSLLLIAQKNQNKKQIAELLNKIGSLYFFLNERELAIEYYEKALKIELELNNKQGVALTYKNIATLYFSWYSYNKAIKYYNKSLSIREKLNDLLEISKLHYEIGKVYYEKGDFNNAVRSYKESLKNDSLLNNKQNIAAALNNLGIIYYKHNDFKKAMEYYNKSLLIYQKIGYKYGSALTLNNIGNINYSHENFNEAIDDYQKSIDIKEELKYFKGIAVSFYNIGNVYKKQKNFEKALEYYNKSNKIAINNWLVEIRYKNYKALSELYAEIDNCHNAVKYYELYVSLKYFEGSDKKPQQISEEIEKYLTGEKDGTMLLEQNNYLYKLSVEKNVEINKFKEEIRKQKVFARVEKQKNEQQIVLLNKEKKLQKIELTKKRIQRNGLLAGFILLAIIFGIIYYSYIQKKKMTVSLKKQKNKIAFQNKEITDSIKYAKKIQTSVLPDEKILNNFITDYFIFFKPKDIVSGDFYWMNDKKDKLILSVADCTGHGVPGAFMSMLAISSLNQIVNEYGITSTSEILNRLRVNIIQALKQKGEDNEIDDGLDISICSINKNDYSFEFAGANSSIYLIKSNNFVEFKGDKMPIGYYLNMKDFSSKSLQLSKGDKIYLFSDGYIDQFGGAEGKKYKSGAFRKLITEIKNYPMEEQKKVISKTFYEWKGNYDQIDDVLIMGICV